MKFCQPHWDMLRAELVVQGIDGWIARDGELAAQQLADQVRRGEKTPVNYCPLMGAHNMVMQRAVTMAGPAIFTVDFGCPICRFNEQRTPDGSCACALPDCAGREPGSVPDFETWISGPTSAPAAARAYMVEQGWLTEAGEPT